MFIRLRSPVLDELVFEALDDVLPPLDLLLLNCQTLLHRAHELLSVHQRLSDLLLIGRFDHRFRDSCYFIGRGGRLLLIILVLTVKHLRRLCLCHAVGATDGTRPVGQVTRHEIAATSALLYRRQLVLQTVQCLSRDPAKRVIHSALVAMHEGPPLLRLRLVRPLRIVHLRVERLEAVHALEETALVVGLALAARRREDFLVLI